MFFCGGEYDRFFVVVVVVVVVSLVFFLWGFIVQKNYCMPATKSPESIGPQNMNPVAGTDMAGRRGELQMMTVVEVAARLGDTAKSKTYNRIPGAGCTEVSVAWT